MNDLALIHKLDFRLFDQQPLDPEQCCKQTGLHMIIQMPLLLPFFDKVKDAFITGVLVKPCI